MVCACFSVEHGVLRSPAVAVVVCGVSAMFAEQLARSSSCSSSSRPTRRRSRRPVASAPSVLNRNRLHPQSLLVLERLRLRRPQMPLLHRRLQRHQILARGAVPRAARGAMQLGELSRSVAQCWLSCSLCACAASSTARLVFLAGPPTRALPPALRNAGRMSVPAPAVQARVLPVAPLILRCEW